MSHDDNDRQFFLHAAPAQVPAHQAPSVQAHGGVVRATARFTVPQETMQAPAHEATRVHTGAIKMGPGGEVTSASTARHVHTDAGTAGGSVMATLRTGANPSVLLIPGDESSRTSLVVAEREGLIRRNAAGRYEDVVAPVADQAAPQGQRPATTEQPAEDPSAGAVDHEEESLWAEDIADMPQHAYDAAAASMVNVVAHGTGSIEDAAKALAVNAGIAPELAREYVQEGYGLHERIVARAVGPLGITGDKLQEFYDATRSNPARLQDAIQRLVHTRDVGGFKALAAEWKAQTADLSVWKANGFQAAVDPQTGDVLVQRGIGPWIKASDLK